jgi:hypothetical protein
MRSTLSATIHMALLKRSQAAAGCRRVWKVDGTQTDEAHPYVSCLVDLEILRDRAESTRTDEGSYTQEERESYLEIILSNTSTYSAATKVCVVNSD